MIKTINSLKKLEKYHFSNFEKFGYHISFNILSTLDSDHSIKLNIKHDKKITSSYPGWNPDHKFEIIINKDVQIIQYKVIDLKGNEVTNIYSNIPNHIFYLETSLGDCTNYISEYLLTPEKIASDIISHTFKIIKEISHFHKIEKAVHSNEFIILNELSNFLPVAPFHFGATHSTFPIATNPRKNLFYIFNIILK